MKVVDYTLVHGEVASGEGEEDMSNDHERDDRQGERWKVGDPGDLAVHMTRYGYPRTPTTVPWPRGTKIPLVRTHVAEHVNEVYPKVVMEHRPDRRPAGVVIHITSIIGVEGVYPTRNEIQTFPMTPVAARELAVLINEAADLADEMDAKPVDDLGERVDESE